ncbi:hypothetical protein [Halalkalicoccus jeotgali]|uniref:Uncharacterized protein n=1 Tax=Halalkalicoccus jeotgali (strain DSM 18796 / CECT 7217 / JCM 14584 / KCTC 4019 / B3) TaxID=795797 RepID=D8JC50_HALJB|nr:hypothetical protein [Halalkalicoccus jeotgali]ADJ16957.1 hypothetical protein HacjB3_18073 [Halalkalicoccus jeotgali B3]ADJ16988.1 hypothetical protein HacjB3_18228 [Halalkalicoccus jeotgali B3]ELY38606.1 hypothetical protein C497_06689 [Halalkalicoccus jeotgali B3]
MTRQGLANRIESLEAERPGDGTVIELRDTVVATPWEPTEGEAPEPGVTEERIEL